MALQAEKYNRIRWKLSRSAKARRENRLTKDKFVEFVGKRAAKFTRRRNLILIIDRLETGEHLCGFGQGLERHAIADSEEFLPHCQHIRVLVCGVDRLPRFPFRH